MKHIYFLLLALLVANGLRAQDDQPEIRTRYEPVPYYPPLEESTVDKGTVIDETGNGISSVGVGYSPSSPSSETSRANILQNIPVNLFTGTPEINIPLASIGEGGLSTTLALNYNQAMLRVHALSSWTGLGWDLTGIPMLSRVVRGFPDEGSLNNNNGQKGYYFYGNNINSNDYFQDKEPDIFILNLPEGAYKFMFDRYKRAHFFPKADIKVDVSYANNPNESGSNHFARIFTEFKVTMPNGTMYYFTRANAEETAEVEVKEAQNNGYYPHGSNFISFLNNRLLTTAWYGSKIESPYGNRLDFTYDRVAYTYYKLAENKANDVCPYTVEKKINKVYIRGVQISSITSANTKVIFNTGTKSCNTDYSVSPPQTVCTYTGAVRYDIDSWGNLPTGQSASKKLLSIEVSDNEPTPLKKNIFTFNYGYFNAADDGTLPAGYTYSDIGYSHQKRLKLQDIILPDGSKYNLSYISENETLQSRLTYGVDHWGFANGITSNTMGLIGLGSLVSNPACGSNRTPNFNYGRKGALAKIHYSTGTDVLLEYEANTAENYTGSIGGLRIKSLLNKDLKRNTEVKRNYAYLDNGQSSGFLSLKPIYRVYDYINGGLLYYVSHSELFNTLNAESGRPIVGYGKVTESIVSNDLSLPSGKNIYYFDQDKTIGDIRQNPQCLIMGQPCYYNPVFFNLTEQDYRLGLPKKQENFQQDGSLLAVQENTYTANGGIKYDSTFCYRTYRFYLSPSNHFDASKSYYQKFKVHRPEMSNSQQYAQDGSGPAISQSTSYTYKDEMPASYRNTYKGTHQMPVEITTTDEKGKVTVQHNKYVADYNFDSQVTYQCDPVACAAIGRTCPSGACMVAVTTVIVPPAAYEARGIYEGLERHLLANPVENYTFQNGKAVAATYQNYYPANSSFVSLPNQNYVLRASPKTGFQQAYYNTANYQMVKDVSYKELSKTSAYNTLGMPTETQARAGAKSRVTYDSGTNLLPLSNTSNFGKADALSSQFTYEKVFQGLSKKTVANGLEEKYTYETGTGRLSYISDKDNKILSKTNYTAANLSSGDGSSTPSAPAISSSSVSLCNVTLSASGCSGTVNWSNGGSGTSIAVPTANSTNYTATCTTSGGTSGNSNTINIPALQSGWAATDIGSIAASCSQLSGAAWILKSNGNLGGAANDQIHYVYRQITGDFTLTVKLNNITSVDGNRSGIMLRSSLNAKAPDFSIFQDGNSYVGTFRRESQGADNLFSGFIQGINNSTWLRLRRQGNTLYYYYSTDGSTWQSNFNFQSGATMPISLANIPNTAYLGFATWGTNNQTTFTNLSITTP